MERFQPLQNKDDDEYWLTVEDFRCNFGSMIICSNSEPYIQEGLNVTRKYNRSDQHFVMQTPHQTPQLAKAKSACLKIRSWSLTDNYTAEIANSTTTKKVTSSESLGHRKVSNRDLNCPKFKLTLLFFFSTTEREIIPRYV